MIPTTWTDPAYKFGWAGPAVVQAWMPRLITGMAAVGWPLRVYDAAPHIRDYRLGKTVVLHHIAKKVLGKHIQSQYQPRGTCVSRGAKRIIDLTQCMQIATGALSEFNYASHAFIYGTCREHGDFLSDQDGAIGAWAAWAVSNDGNLRNSDVGDDDNKDDLAVKWGRTGVPNDIKTKGREHLIKRIVPVKTPEEGGDLICAFFGLTIASGVGYEGNGGFKRDKDGVCKAGGSWPHQMCYTGYCDDLAGRGPHFLQDQSWGPESPSGPTGDIDIPSYSFWTSKADVARQMRENDCFAFGDLVGWDIKPLDQYV